MLRARSISSCPPATSKQRVGLDGARRGVLRPQRANEAAVQQLEIGGYSHDDRPRVGQLASRPNMCRRSAVLPVAAVDKTRLAWSEVVSCSRRDSNPRRRLESTSTKNAVLTSNVAGGTRACPIQLCVLARWRDMRLMAHRSRWPVVTEIGIRVRTRPAVEHDGHRVGLSAARIRVFHEHEQAGEIAFGGEISDVLGTDTDPRRVRRLPPWHRQRRGNPRPRRAPRRDATAPGRSRPTPRARVPLLSSSSRDDCGTPPTSTPICLRSMGRSCSTTRCVASTSAFTPATSTTAPASTKSRRCHSSRGRQPCRGGDHALPAA